MNENSNTFEAGNAAIQLLSPEAQERWRPARSVPFRLTITVPVPGLKLRSLRALRTGTIFLTDRPAAEDVPVTVAGVMLGWGELDNVDGQMALRLTRLA
jgi:flagellar motor switch/type III secretory pathway protein FliN